MALARLKSIEALRYDAPGEWGNLLGLDRVPEVRTLRAKIHLLAQDDRPVQWSAALCERWMAAAPEAVGVLYIDGHVRVYNGSQTLPTAIPTCFMALGATRVPLAALRTTVKPSMWVRALSSKRVVYRRKMTARAVVFAPVFPRGSARIDFHSVPRVCLTWTLDVGKALERP